MKRVLAYTLTLFTALFSFGYTTADSVKVYFNVNKSKLNPSLWDNAAAMDSLIVKIRNAADCDNLSKIEVHSFASPDGPLRFNERLARQRCDSVVSYIIAKTGVSRDYIQAMPGGVAWEGLRTLVDATPDVPARDQVLEILDGLNCYDQSTKIGGGAVNQKVIKRKLVALNGGRPYRWMLAKLFPQLRYALNVIVTLKSDSVPQTEVDQKCVTEKTDADSSELLIVEEIPATDQADECLADSLVSEDLLSDTPVPITLPNHRLAIKTNLLYYAALMPNIEVEWMINDRWSAALDWDIAWWGDETRDKSYRLSMISAEGRRWIKPRKPWHGMFVGLFAGGGWYDLRNGGPGYYGEGMMTGASFGYMWPISRNLSFESSIGAGYVYTRYKEYVPFEGHHLYQRTKSLNYFGPLKLKFSIVWRLLDSNRTKRTDRGI